MQMKIKDLRKIIFETIQEMNGSTLVVDGHEFSSAGRNKWKCGRVVIISIPDPRGDIQYEASFDGISEVSGDYRLAVRNLAAEVGMSVEQMLL